MSEAAQEARAAWREADTAVQQARADLDAVKAAARRAETDRRQAQADLTVAQLALDRAMLREEAARQTLDAKLAEEQAQ